MSWKYLGTGEAAKQLGISRKTLLSWIKKGYLKARKLPSGHHRIPSQEVVRLRAEMRDGPTKKKDQEVKE